MRKKAALLIVYTPAAATWASNNEGGINNTISSVMNRAQLTLDNSNTNITLNLVHTAQVDYVEWHSNDDLNNLTFNNDGYMDEVHTWRDAYGADVVVLLEETGFTGGLAWLLTNESGSPGYAFSLTRVQQASWTYTMIHEIGHNMGAHHHKDQIDTPDGNSGQPGPTNWWNWAENEWSAGWRWTGTDNGKYCSVMTYESGDYFEDGVDHLQVPYFSNPNISYQGVPTGDAVDADNARTLREIKNVVAGYRNEPDGEIINITAAICEGDSYEFGYQVLYDPGEYTEVFESNNGSDSTVTLSLIAYPTYNHTAEAVICQGEVYPFGTRELTESGEYTEIFETSEGCDSTVTLSLIVHPTYNHTAEAVICQGEVYPFGTRELTESGEYTEIFETVNGCDSIVYLTLVKSVNTFADLNPVTHFSLGQNYPNPFIETTTIPFKLKINVDEVVISVFDNLGREIHQWQMDNLNAGSYNVYWKEKIRSGVYYYKINIKQNGQTSYKQTKRMVVK